MHKEEKTKINSFFDSCKFDKSSGKTSPFKTMMDASKKINIKGVGIKEDGVTGGLYDKKGRLKDPNVLYWFRTP